MKYMPARSRSGTFVYRERKHTESDSSVPDSDGKIRVNSLFVFV